MSYLNRLFMVPAAVIAILTLIMMGCGPADDTDPYHSSLIEGRITVDDELDPTGDYSGIELRIIIENPGAAGADTLFHAVTDQDGFYSAEARFPERGAYRLNLLRRGNVISSVNLILSQSDTVRFDAMLPDVEETKVVESRENDLYRTYQRLENGLDRLIRYANAGLVAEDTLDMELRKWSDLYWDFYLEHPDTFIGEQSAVSSVRLLEGWEDELMMERLAHITDEIPALMPLAADLGSRHLSRTEGLDGALDYIETLAKRELDDQVRMELERTRIKLLYDSARVEAVRNNLADFKVRFSGIEEASNWAEQLEKDLEKLAPGTVIPDFSLVTLDGDTLSRESLKGTAYILEFTRLENFLYQQQFDRTVAIYHIYKNYDVEILTVAFGSHEMLLNAFFEERTRLWPFAMPGTFDTEELSDQFNINMVPTRILVGRYGTIVRKYEGAEFNDIVAGLQSVLNVEIEEEETL